MNEDQREASLVGSFLFDEIHVDGWDCFPRTLMLKVGWDIKAGHQDKVNVGDDMGKAPPQLSWHSTPIGTLWCWHFL